MLGVILGTGFRIFSNSYLNVFQKILTNNGNKSSVVNFYTYLGLFVLSLFLIPFFTVSYSASLVINFFAMGFLGALGNYFIIKALSLGELSSLAPINSYKPVVAMIIAFLYLKEIPSFVAVLGILLIIAGTYILYCGISCKNNLAIFYRTLALIFSGTEAVFIKKVILLTNIPTSFALWAVSGLIFSSVFVFFKRELKIPQVKHLILLIVSVAIMQYSTNYVFSKINVSYALALFQLSTLLSVFLGVNIFNESGLRRKVIASLIMIIGAIVIILS